MTSAVGDMDLGVEVSKGTVLKFLQAGLGFVGTIIFAQVLGPTTFGGFYLLLSLVQIVDFPTSGVASAAKKRYSEAEFARSEVVGLLLLFNTMFLGVAIVFVAILSPWLVSLTGLKEAPILFVVMFGSMIFFYPFQRLLVADGRLSFSVLNDTVRSVLTLGLQLILVYSGWEASGMAYGWALSTIPPGVYAFYKLTSGVSVPTRSTIRSIWSFARYSTLQSLLGKAYSRYDVLLIGALLTPALAGNYEVAFKLTVPGSYIGTVVGSGLMVKVSDLDSRGEAVSREVTNALAFVSLLAIPIFFGSLALSDELITIVYGAAYSDAAPLLVGLAFYQVTRTQTKIFQRTLNGLDRPETNTKISAATLFLNVSLGAGLAMQIGAIGVVIATVVGELLRYLLSSIAVRRQVSDVTLFSPAFQSQFVAGLGMFGLVWLISAGVEVGIWYELLSLVGLGAAAYFLILIVISGMFRHTAKSILARLAA